MNHSTWSRRAFCWSLGLGPLAVTAPAADEEAKKKAATKAAQEWLALIDAGEYGRSWETSAALFQRQVPQQRWAELAGKTREPLGKVESRELAGASFATSLPGAPDGEYVVIQYRTAFTQKQQAVETVTPMKDPDGAWRVSGYFIR